MNIRFIINERAGQGKGLLEWRKLRADAYPHDFTRSRGHATELARQIIQQQSEPFLLIVVGGDGTIHEVLNGVAGHSHVTVGVVKAGSGNDFAREFPSFTCLKAIENFSEAISVQHRAVDFGQVRLAEKSSRYFASNCGFGLDAEISLAASQSKWKKRLNKWKLGHLVYVLTVVRSLLVFTPFEAIIQNGNEKRIFKDCWLITVNNQKYFGGGMKISPHSVVDDGEFELIVVHSIPLLEFLIVFLTVFTGHHVRFSGVSIYKSDSFTIHPVVEVACHTDGEYIGTTDIQQPVICRVDSRKWFIAEGRKVK